MGGGILEGNPDNPHESQVTGIAKAFDPTSYILPDEMTGHAYAPQIMEGINTTFSPITGFVEDTLNFTTPGKQWLEGQVPILGQWSDTMRNRPGDAAAIAASMYGAGAAAGAMGGAGATGAGTGGTLGSAGSTAATSAITPTFSSGAGMAASAAPSALQLSAGAGGTGIGTLGSAGTTAALNGLTPAFASQGAASGTGSYLGQLYDRAKDLYGQGKEIKGYYDRTKQVYDLLNPDQQPQQDLSEPMQITNPYRQIYDPNRLYRGV